MKRRLLVVGWDGATWEYVRPLLDQGRLPTLRQLLQRGTHGTLTSTIPPFTNIAWPSLVTGLSPESTGIFDGARAEPGSEQVVPTNLTGFRGIPIWQWVNRFGLRSGVINVPMTYPTNRLRGYMVSGFDSPVHATAVTYPRHLLKSWADAGNPYRILEEEVALMAQQNPHQDRGDLYEFVQRWEDLTREQGQFIRWLWQERPVDLLFTVFTGTDSINHRTRDFSLVARVYEAADEALGQILRAVDDDTLICLVSDHGSTPAFRYVSLYKALADGGWLHFKPHVAHRFLGRLPGDLGQRLPHLWQQTPALLRRLFSWPLLQFDPRLAVDADNVDWKRTKVFARSGMGPLYLNHQDRAVHGIVSDKEYATLLDEVKRHFLGLRDERGKRLFTTVVERQMLYPDADPEDDPPDIVLQPASWSDHMITGYPTDPLVRQIPDDREYGTHTPEGIFFLAGQGIRSASELPRAAAIVDVVPTLLAAANLPIPVNLDGKVLDHIFQEPPAPQFVSATAAERQRPSTHSDEAQEVMDRLRDLGYL